VEEYYYNASRQLLQTWANIKTRARGRPHSEVRQYHMLDSQLGG